MYKMSESLKELAERTRREHASKEVVEESKNELPEVEESVEDIESPVEEDEEEDAIIIGTDDEDDSDLEEDEQLTEEELYEDFELTDDDLKAEMPDLDMEEALLAYPKIREEIEKYRKNLIIHQGFSLEEANTAAISRLKKRGKEENDAYLEKHPKVGIVEIDKKNVDNVEFTSEEREKLSKVKVIELHVVEEQELPTMKIKKVSKKERSAILQNLENNLSQYSVPLPIMHDYVRFRGAQIIQMVQAVQFEDDKPEDVISKKASLVYTQLSGGTNLVKYDEEGKCILTYNDFINKFPYHDLDMAMYAILVASSTENLELELTCRSCDQAFTVSYNTKEFLSVNDLPDNFKKKFDDILKNRKDTNFLIKGYDENSKAIQVESPITHNRYDITYPTVGVMIDMYKAINQEDPTIVYLSAMVAFVHKMYIYDNTSDSYVEIFEDEYKELFDAFQVLPQEELDILSKFLEPFIYKPTFLLKSKCTKCGNEMTNELSIDNLVFLKARNSRVETR